MKNLMNRLWKEEDGQDLIEYSLLLTLLALTCTAAISPLATAISECLQQCFDEPQLGSRTTQLEIAPGSLAAKRKTKRRALGEDLCPLLSDGAWVSGRDKGEERLSRSA